MPVSMSLAYRERQHPRIHFRDLRLNAGLTGGISACEQKYALAVTVAKSVTVLRVFTMDAAYLGMRVTW